MPEGPILIVDDEEDLGNLLEINFGREGFDTLRALNGRDALRMAAEHRPALIVLDLNMPDLTGMEVCRRIRATEAISETPIIMLTARGEEIDRVVGFQVGADDYVVKSSFSVRELILRVRAVLRRRQMIASAQGPSSDECLEYEGFTIDVDAHRVWVDGVEIQLTATEFKLLITLARNPGRVQTRGSLLEKVWDMPPDLNTRTVDTHIKRLREKLRSAAVYVETVRGVGYRFNRAPETV